MTRFLVLRADGNQGPNSSGNKDTYYFIAKARPGTANIVDCYPLFAPAPVLPARCQQPFLSILHAYDGSKAPSSDPVVPFPNPRKRGSVPPSSRFTRSCYHSNNLPIPNGRKFVIRTILPHHPLIIFLISDIHSGWKTWPDMLMRALWVTKWRWGSGKSFKRRFFGESAY